MKILINATLYEFKMFGIDMCSEFDIYDRESEFSGTFSIYNMYNDNFNIVNNVALLSDNLDYRINLGEPHHLYKHDDNLITLKFSISNIFEFHQRITKLLIVDSIDQKISHSLRCFNLPLICNLKCPYCSQGYVHKYEVKRFDKYIATTYIQKEQESINSLINDDAVTDRYMGGETLVDWDEFIRTTRFYSFRFPESDHFRIYTNGTIHDSINKLKDFILNDVHYKDYDIWVSIDSLDIEHSSRISKLSDMISFKKNLKVLQSMLTIENVKINFNVMYNGSPKEFIKTIRSLHDMGFRYFKFGFEESITSIDNYNHRFRIGPRLVRMCTKYMELSKMNIDKMLIYKFEIKDFGTEVYSNKISVMTNRNHIEIYESVTDNHIHTCDRLLILT